MDVTKEQKGGVFLNGKEQVIDLLRALSTEEKSRLLRNIQLRNPAMATELSERSYSWKSIESLDDRAIAALTGYINPQIVGIALRVCHVKFQRRVLSSMDRSRAEEAYHAMTANLTDERNAVRKAQEKVLSLAINLNRKRVITLH